MRLKSLSLILTPTTLHRHITHTQPTKLPFITFPTYFSKFFTQSGILQLNFSGLHQLSGLQRPSSTALFACPSTTSTSFFCTHASPGKWLFVVNLGMIYWWLLSIENVLPVVFLELFWLHSYLHYNLPLQHKEKNLSRINPKSLIYPTARCKMK